MSTLLSADQDDSSPRGRGISAPPWAHFPETTPVRWEFSVTPGGLKRFGFTQPILHMCLSPVLFL